MEKKLLEFAKIGQFSTAVTLAIKVLDKQPSAPQKSKSVFGTVSELLVALYDADEISNARNIVDKCFEIFSNNSANVNNSSSTKKNGSGSHDSSNNDEEYSEPKDSNSGDNEPEEIDSGSGSKELVKFDKNKVALKIGIPKIIEKLLSKRKFEDASRLVMDCELYKDEKTFNDFFEILVKERQYKLAFSWLEKDVDLVGCFYSKEMLVNELIRNKYFELALKYILDYNLYDVKKGRNNVFEVDILIDELIKRKMVLKAIQYIKTFMLNDPALVSQFPKYSDSMLMRELLNNREWDAAEDFLNNSLQKEQVQHEIDANYVLTLMVKAKDWKTISKYLKKVLSFDATSTAVNKEGDYLSRVVILSDKDRLILAKFIHDLLVAREFTKALKYVLKFKFHLMQVQTQNGAEFVARPDFPFPPVVLLGRMIENEEFGLMEHYVQKYNLENDYKAIEVVCAEKKLVALKKYRIRMKLKKSKNNLNNEEQKHQVKGDHLLQELELDTIEAGTCVTESNVPLNDDDLLLNVGDRFRTLISESNSNLDSNLDSDGAQQIDLTNKPLGRKLAYYLAHLEQNKLFGTSEHDNFTNRGNFDETHQSLSSKGYQNYSNLERTHGDFGQVNASQANLMSDRHVISSNASVYEQIRQTVSDPRQAQLDAQFMHKQRAFAYPENSQSQNNRWHANSKQNPYANFEEMQMREVANRKEMLERQTPQQGLGQDLHVSEQDLHEMLRNRLRGLDMNGNRAESDGMSEKVAEGLRSREANMGRQYQTADTQERLYQEKLLRDHYQDQTSSPTPAQNLANQHLQYNPQQRGMGMTVDGYQQRMANPSAQVAQRNLNFPNDLRSNMYSPLPGGNLSLRPGSSTGLAAGNFRPGSAYDESRLYHQNNYRSERIDEIVNGLMALNNEAQLVRRNLNILELKHEQAIEANNIGMQRIIHENYQRLKAVQDQHREKEKMVLIKAKQDPDFAQAVEEFQERRLLAQRQREVRDREKQYQLQQQAQTQMQSGHQHLNGVTPTGMGGSTVNEQQARQLHRLRQHELEKQEMETRRQKDEMALLRKKQEYAKQAQLRQQQVLQQQQLQQQRYLQYQQQELEKERLVEREQELRQLQSQQQRSQLAAKSLGRFEADRFDFRDRYNPSPSTLQNAIGAQPYIPKHQGSLQKIPSEHGEFNFIQSLAQNSNEEENDNGNMLSKVRQQEETQNYQPYNNYSTIDEFEFNKNHNKDNSVSLDASVDRSDLYGLMQNIQANNNKRGSRLQFQGDNEEDDSEFSAKAHSSFSKHFSSLGTEEAQRGMAPNNENDNEEESLLLQPGRFQGF